MKQLNTERRDLFSDRARYDVIEFSNCRVEERSKDEFFHGVRTRNGVIWYSITEQSTTSYVFTLLEHGHIQNDVIMFTVSDNAQLAQWEMTDNMF